MTIPDLNCFHGDASAAIVRDGTLVAVAEEEEEEERFRRIKHRVGFPAQAIAYCPAEAGISLVGLFRLGCNSSCAARGGKNNSCRTAPRRPDDPPVFVGSADRAKAPLEWIPKRSALELQIADPWK